MGAVRVDNGISITIKEVQAALQADEEVGRTIVTKLGRLLGHHDKQTKFGASKTRGPLKGAGRIAAAFIDAKAATKLATEVANECLKRLSVPTKSGSDRKRNDEVNRSPLKAVDNNVISSPKRSSANDKAAAQVHDHGGQPFTARIAAECACIAFRYLETTRQAFDPRICDGLMVLCGRLLSNECFDLAEKALNDLRHVLETTVPNESGSSSASREHLLNISIATTADADLLQRVILYQSMVIRLAAARPQDQDFLLCALRNEQTGPAAMISKWMASGGDQSKGASYLQTLSTYVLAIAPLNGHAIMNASSTAVDAYVTRLHLQTLALQYRREWWSLVNHNADDEALGRDVSRALRLLTASTADKASASVRYTAAQECLKLLHLDPSSSSDTSDFDIALSMWQLAHAAHDVKASASWNDSLVLITKVMPSNHAKQICTRVVGLFQCHNKNNAILTEDISVQLRGKLCGSSMDVMNLLCVMSSLFVEHKQSLRQSAADSALCQLLLAALKVAQRLWRSCEDTVAPHLLSLVRTALQVPSLRRSLSAAIGIESLELLIKRGTLGQIASLARTSSAKEAWNSCGDAVVMSQVIKLLMHRAAQSEPPVVHNTDLLRGLQPAERAVLLQARIEKLADMAAIGKHIKPVGQLVTTAFEELSTILDAEQYPIRRQILDGWYVIAQDALGVQKDSLQHDSYPSPKFNDLAEDKGLAQFQQDVLACSHIARFLLAPSHKGPLLEKAIKEWLMLLDDQKAAFYNPDMSIRLIDLAIAYHDAVLETNTSIRLLVLKLKLQKRQHGTRYPAGTLAQLLGYLSSGSDQPYVRSIVDLLQHELDQNGHDELTKLQAYVALASWHINRSETDACRLLLGKAAVIGESLSASTAPRHDRLSLLETCTKLWKAQSMLSLHDNKLAEALVAAKNSLMAANSIWRLSVRTSKPPDVTSEMKEEFRAGRNGVSRLQLVTEASELTKADSRQSGALYWKGVHASCAALLHLSDIYAHFGDFVDADAYSRQALTMAMPVEQSNLLTSVRSHRAALLTKAGRQEEAAMMQAKNDPIDPAEQSGRATVKHFVASALLALHEKDNYGALEAIREAKQCHERSERSSRQQLSGLHFMTTSDPVKHTTRPQKQSTRSKTSSAMPLAKAQAVQTGDRDSIDMSSDFGILPIKDNTIIMLERRIAQREDPANDSGSYDPNQTHEMTCSAKHLQFDYAMSRLDDYLRQDLRLNALRDMVIVQPTLLDRVSLPRMKDNRAVQKTITKQKHRTNVVLPNILETAQSAVQSNSRTAGFANVAEIYEECSMSVELLSYESILEHSTAVSSASGCEQERASSMAHLRHSTALRSKPKGSKSSLPWRVEEVPESLSFDFAEFRVKYIDVLPEKWTATSLHLNEEESKLFIARYRKDQLPLIASLPLERTNDELDVHAAFDYKSAKAELLDIIDRSNKSCHASTGARKTKSDWWREREDLDRQLGALIDRISSEWLSGFIGLLSTQKASGDCMGQVRKMLGSFVERYWAKNNIELSNAIVELFTHVVTSSQDAEDYAPAVLDLLCFLNDYLRVKEIDLLNDEADFDSMAVQLSEALSHVSDPRAERHEQEHLVLILDKRLQMFPWESLSYLSGVSVSRLGSMSMLREQILAMRKQCIAGSDGLASIPRDSGTAIVNPSSDLVQTEAALRPMLSQLTEHAPGWMFRSRHVPSEEEFSQALSSSSIFMYFGHGSGAQYIRPQAVRRLKNCSQAVWLMGCSSGNVREHGAYEPSSMPYHYLLANEGNQEDSLGSPTKCLGVVANLWDVTDKDIDRFSLETGRRWGLWQSNEDCSSVKTRRKAEPTKVPVTPKRPNKAQHGPGARQTSDPDDLAMPSLSSQMVEPIALGKAVAQSRDVCFLRYLNGAAPVLYGIPMSLARS